MSVLDFIDLIVLILLGHLSFDYERKSICVNAGCAYLLLRYLFVEYNTGFIDVMFILNIISFIACTLSLILDTSFKDSKKLNNVSAICMLLVWSCLVLNIVKDLIM